MKQLISILALCATAKASHAASTENGLRFNGLQLNGFTLNGLASNVITFNGVSSNVITINGVSSNVITINGTQTADGSTLSALSALAQSALK